MNGALADLEDKLEKVENQNDCSNVAKAIDEWLDVEPVTEVLKRVTQVSREFNDFTLGYFIWPGVKRKLEQTPALLPELKKLLLAKGVLTRTRLHCLDLLDKVFRKKARKNDTAYPEEDVNLLCKTALKPSIQLEVRKRATRYLSGAGGKKQSDKLKSLIDSTLKSLIDSWNVELVNAAADAVLSWEDGERTIKIDLVKEIEDFVKNSPEMVKNKSGILRLLANSKNMPDPNILDAVMSETRNHSDWLKISQLVGHHVNTGQLAKIVKAVAGKKGGRTAIRCIFKRDPSLLEKLYKEKYYTAYVKVVAAYPELVKHTPLSNLEDIAKLNKPKISDYAFNLFRELKTSLYFKTPSEKLADKRRKTQIFNNIVCDGEKQLESDPYSTGFQVGDALYRDTFIQEPFTHNHWHAGIFQNFQFLEDYPGRGAMSGVHISWRMKHFSAERFFGNANAQVADIMKALQVEFIEGSFFVGKNKDGYSAHGARCVPGLSMEDRFNILETAEELSRCDNIFYGWGNMIYPCGWSNWDGTIPDILAIRCDGVVEYVYESNGIKVCEGTDSSKWDIAYPTMEHLDSHADLHTFDLEPGELCPRVQAGDEGNDTTFITPPESGPSIEEFAVSVAKVGFKKIICIRLKVTSHEYDKIYLRVVVRPENGRFKFAVTEDTVSGTGIPGHWMFKEINAGVDHIAFWRGRTMDQGQIERSRDDTTYEFRAVAIDQGGNVSGEYSFKIPIDWRNLKKISVLNSGNETIC